MRFDVVIELLVPGGYEQDAIGQQVEAAPAFRSVYANEFSVGTREFYEAGAQGMKPERQYQVRAIDYEEEREVRVDGVIYSIIRVMRAGEFVRLTCEKRAGDE